MLSGNGTAGSPYLVGTKTELIELFATASYYTSSNKYISLTADIDFGNDYWLTNQYPWRANLDGNNHIIQNMNISSSYLYDTGFFSKVSSAFTSSGGIRNFQLHNITVEKRDTHGGVSVLIGNLGPFASGSEISNIKIVSSSVLISSSVVTMNDNGIGGAIGYCSGSFNVSTNGVIKNIGVENLQLIYSGSGNVSVPVYIGGFVGYGATIINTEIYNSYVNGLYIYSNLVTGAHHLGGFAGRSKDSNVDTQIKIYNCYARGYITGNTGSVGAVGRLTAGTNRIGGFVGDNRLPISSSYASVVLDFGDASSYVRVGSFIGDQSNSTCVNIFYNSTISGVARAGGGTGLTTTQFTTYDILNNPYANLPSNAWGYNATINDGYPYLINNYYVYTPPIPADIYNVEYSDDGIIWNTLYYSYSGSIDPQTLLYSIPRTVTTQLRIYNTGADPSSATITHVGDMRLSFQTRYTVNTHKYICVIKPNELNMSSNKTLYDTDGTLITDKIYTDQGGNQIHFNMDSNFDYYITSIGLYDNLNKLVAYAKLGRPYKINRKLDTVFVIKFDI